MNEKGTEAKKKLTPLCFQEFAQTSLPETHLRFDFFGIPVVHTPNKKNLEGGVTLNVTA